MNEDLLPHRRYNPLLREWIIVSPQRANRPWKGRIEEINVEKELDYDEACYLCPTNSRINGKKNPDYKSVYTFINDYSAMIPGREADTEIEENKLFKKMTINGICKVTCFSPLHSDSLSKLPAQKIAHVIEEWIKELNELKNHYKWIQIFENKGKIMGCSNPHPHSQIWASDFIPKEIKIENNSQLTYRKKYGTPLLVDYFNQELAVKKRIVCQNENWLVVVPYWAVWPFETLLLPKRHIKRLTDITEDEKRTLSTIMKELLEKYDTLFEFPFPYSMGWHSAPFDNKIYDHWQLHAHYYSPILRSSSVIKYMVGYELLSESQRDITPEQAALKLRNSK